MLPAHQVLTWPREGLQLLSKKQALFLQHLYNYWLAEEWQILDYSVFQKENAGAQTLHCCFVSNLTSGIRNTVPRHSNWKYKEGSSKGRRNPTDNSQLPPPLTIMHLSTTALWSNMESGRSPSPRTLGKDYLIQLPIQHPGHSHCQPSSGPFLLWTILAFPLTFGLASHSTCTLWCFAMTSMFATSPRLATSTKQQNQHSPVLQGVLTETLKIK